MPKPSIEAKVAKASAPALNPTLLILEEGGSVQEQDLQRTIVRHEVHNRLVDKMASMRGSLC